MSQARAAVPDGAAAAVRHGPVHGPHGADGAARLLCGAGRGRPGPARPGPGRPPRPGGAPGGPQRRELRGVRGDRAGGPGAAGRRRGRSVALAPDRPGRARWPGRLLGRRHAVPRRPGPDREPDAGVDVRRPHHPVRGGHGGGGLSRSGARHRAGHPVRGLWRHHRPGAIPGDGLRLQRAGDPGVRAVRAGGGGGHLDHAALHARPARRRARPATADRDHGPVGVRRGRSSRPGSWMARRS